VEGNILKKVLKENIFSKLKVNRQSEELSAAGLENLVSCPFCPYQTIMDNLQDKVIRCLNPECGRDSCRKCKMANHIPLTFDEVITRSRRRLEEELTMSWVRECSNCKINFERISGCHMMTCPRCGQMTCYTCRQSVTPGGGYQQHARCGDTKETRNNDARHQEELAQAEKRLKTDMDLLKPGPSK
jgi:TRIAD3 protein (E3 ubiquitin-protein ligase RNF216)